MSKDGFNNKKVVEQFLTQRGLLFEIYFIAFLLALGTSTISNYLFFYQNNIKLLIIGILLCSFSLLYISIKKLKSLNYSENFDCFFIYDETNKKLINIPNYDFVNGLYINFNFHFY